ncbi:hypothetical protein QN367_01875 [Cryobacterium sp. RTS3]|uniref:hypothetical protein n=1 Tax=Cryobacterium sp. RTS3 TaxID=3048643 RepID=UPI002B2355F9|nr:hypothetical protein [Cryobacterium sp. RTS3]MEA9997839.1 hypothetical protein [Cryobacterium sp. RTS3]
MSAEKSRPTANGAAQELTNATTASLKPEHSNPAKPAALIGATVEKPLDAILWKIILGHAELHQLTPALFAWWTLAHDTGRASRQAEIDRLSDENDRLYLRANNDPKQVAAITQRRLDGHFERESERFFAEVTR